MPYILFAATCLLFGSNFILMSKASQALGAIEVAALRVFGAVVVLGVLWRVSDSKSISRRLWPVAAFIALLSQAYPYSVQPYLISQGYDHSFLAMMVAFTPLLTVMVSIPLLGVRPTLRQLVGVLGGFGFLALLMLDGSGRGLSLGMLAMAITVPLGYAIGNTLIQRYLSDVSATPLTLIILVFSLAMLTPLAFASPVLQPLGLAGPSHPEHWMSSLLAVAALGVLGTGVTVYLFVHLVLDQGPLFAGMVTYVVPVVAMLWGVFDSETITLRQVIAIIGVLSTVALVQYGAVTIRAKADLAPPRDAAMLSSEA